MQVKQECSTGDLREPRYAFYDKEHIENDGWVWFHRNLVLSDIIKFYRDEFLSRVGNDSTGQGFVRLERDFVLYRFRRGGEDSKQRNHWVLLLAWIPVSWHSRDALRVLNEAVFQHFSNGGDGIPAQLSEFDYNPIISQLTYSGAEVEVPADKVRFYLEEIENRGSVKVVLYKSLCDDKAKIGTQKAASH